jgi:PAS domain S-box-containing protein
MRDDDHAHRDAITLNRLILRSIVDHAIITLDMECRVTSWNEGAERLLGWTEEEAIGQSGDIFFTPEDVAKDRPEHEMRTALKEGRADDERWHMRKDGSRFWASGLMMPLLADDIESAGLDGDCEHMRGFVKIFRDRTAHEKARRRIASLEQRATLAMKRVGTVGVFEFDAAKRTLIADAVAADLHNLPRKAAETGLPLSRLFEKIHPDDVAHVKTAIERAIKNSVDLDASYRTLSDAPRPGWIHAQAAVQRNVAGRIIRLSGIAVDITEQRDITHMQEMQLSFVDEVRDMKLPIEIAELACRTIAKTLHASRAGHGYVENDGDTINIRAEWNDADSTSIIGRHHISDFGRYGEQLMCGETVVMEDTGTDPRIDDPSRLAAIQINSMVNMPLMGNGKLRAVLFVNDDRPRHWSAAELNFMRAIFDRTYAAKDRLRFEIERNLMTAELAHRMKNMLTMAQVVVTQTLRGTNDIAAARTAITARLHALSEAQDVLTRVDNREVAVREVVISALKPHLGSGDRVLFSGPTIMLNAQQVLGLALGLHELATNAAKYGALASDVGRVTIQWALDAGKFLFTWTESGGPDVSPPSSAGFGSKILNQVVGGYFEGTTKLIYDPAGLRFVLSGTC